MRQRLMLAAGAALGLAAMVGFGTTTVAASSSATNSPDATSPAAASTPIASLDAGQELTAGMSLISARYTLTLRSSGDLVETWLGRVVFDAGTKGASPTLKMQQDGNLVLYARGHALWSSRTASTTAVGAWKVTLLSTGQLSFTLGTRTKVALLHSTGVMVDPATGSAFIPAAGSGSGGGDAGDPTALWTDGHYDAFTTGTVLGNFIQALVSTAPTSGYHSYTGEPFGSTALPNPPGWETPNTQTSPSVIAYKKQWLLFYDADPAPFGESSGQTCLAVATTTSLSPNPSFGTQPSQPLLCEPNLGGLLDPSAFVDPATGAATLIWKTNDGGSNQASSLQTATIHDRGGVVSLGAPTTIYTINTVAFPWETTTDDPDLVFANGHWVVIFSVGNFQESTYAEAYITCASPAGPCVQPPRAEPFLSQANGAPPGGYGPAGGSLMDTPSGWYLVYEAWKGGQPGCTSYACGAVRRLYVAPIDLGQ